jgi:hypothetical protein
MPINLKIVSLIADAKGEGGKIVMIVDAILAILMAAKLAHRQTLPPGVVGIHPANRDGHGVSATEVHALGVDITAMGWSPDACSHAVCIEADTEGAIIDFTMKVKNESEGLASCTASEIAYGSLSCSHTNQFLCCVIAAIPSQHESLCSDGRMSKAMLSDKDQGLSKALVDGLSWIVLKQEVQLLYPDLPDLIQKARNDPGRAQRQEGEVQVLLRIASLAKSNATTSGIGEVSVAWEAYIYICICIYIYI